MSQPPSLDIVIPVRNGGEALVATLHALVESEDGDFRLLISDNHSTDGNPWQRVLERFRPGQVVRLHPPEPLGRVEHWTWAARRADAPFCKFLLCGDRIPPDYIGKVRGAFAARPDLIYTPYVILQHGRTLEELRGELVLRNEMRTLTGGDYFARCGTRLNFIGPLSAVTFRTEALRAALPFDPLHGWTADWRLYTRIMHEGTAIYCQSTYCIQDRTIARLSSSFRGVLNGAFEERAYRRELTGLGAATPLGRYREVFRPVAAHLVRSLLPASLSRPLLAVGRKLAGRRR
jgi:glycosyltransferase involved in cell wall biosynthesis